LERKGAAIAARNLGKTTKQIQRERLKAGGFFLTWLLFVSIVGGSRILEDFSTMPPRFILFLIVIVVATFLVAFSRLGTLLVSGLPISYLVGYQVFRIFVEFGLYSAYVEKIAPIQMTFLGINHDILSGASALIIAAYAKSKNSKTIIMIWNVLCLLLLVKIVVVAVLSSPTSFRYFMNDPANTFVAQMPYIFLPGILVPFALLGHILVFRSLLKKKEKLATILR
jgi:hypothetical protein